MSPSWSDLDPFNRNSVWRRLGRELDPASKKSAVSKILDSIHSLFPEGLEGGEDVAERIQNIAQSAANSWANSHRRVGGSDHSNCIAAASSAVIDAGNNDSEIKKVLDADGSCVAQEAAKAACDFVLNGRR
jgi:hypothetical protein